MMNGTISGAGLALLAGFAFAQPAASEPLPISQTLVRTLPPDEVARRVADQIGNLLARSPSRGFKSDQRGLARVELAHILSRGGETPGDVTSAANRARLASLLLLDQKSVPQSPQTLDELKFRTRNVAVLLPGMCVYDYIPVQFLPVGPDSGPDALVTAAWLDITHEYHFLTPPPVALADPYAFHDRRKADEDCAKLEGTKLANFTAGNDASALRGYWLAEVLRQKVVEGNAAFPADCGPAYGATECRKQVLDFLSSWYQVLECSPVSLVCSLFGYERELRISATSGVRPAITGISLRPVGVIQNSPQ